MVLRGELGGPLGIEEAIEPEVFERLRSNGTIRFKIRIGIFCFQGYPDPIIVVIGLSTCPISPNQGTRILK